MKLMRAGRRQGNIPRDISNRTIVLLLGLALIVTLFSAIVSFNKLAELGWTIQSLTGAATTASSGETNVTINAVTSMTLATGNHTMDFGTGAVNSSCDACIMDSNATNASQYSNASTLQDGGLCCRIDGSTAFSGPGDNGFLLENTGNLNISVGYTCTRNCTFGTFLGGTRAAAQGGLEIRVAANNVAKQSGESGATDTVASCAGGGTYYRSIGWNITNSSAWGGALGGNDQTRDGYTEATYLSLSSRGHWLCGNATHFPLQFGNTADAGVVDINITILSDAPATGVESSVRLTFNGTSSG